VSASSPTETRKGLTLEKNERGKKKEHLKFEARLERGGLLCVGGGKTKEQKRNKAITGKGDSSEHSDLLEEKTRKVWQSFGNRSCGGTLEISKEWREERYVNPWCLGTTLVAS